MCGTLNTSLFSLWPILINNKDISPVFGTGIEGKCSSCFCVADESRGRVKQNSRICSLLKTENTLFCLQQNQCHLLGPVSDDTKVRGARAVL